ncbi:hypothetical protein IAF05_09810 [Dickeya dianthicola]|uniref:hypothetical protein n=1 Tax=Dickeya dianthicola TaxID=204039 RepID=UPI001BDE16B3|nr:hypothetical protein [Dickeya dianthicola]MBT1427990.1 hypothetical protein [Dickeya dianthicola]MBT1459504.1 hypothetical protein [Dickeya dianthicola]MBT1488702.1 hypothetical protein [Dickeya dianthicola]
MNSYRENLQDTVGNALSALYTQQQQLQSQLYSAQYSLYYAQGAQLSAIENLTSTGAQLLASRIISDQGVKNDNLLTNLLSSATQVQVATATTVTNSATAAATAQTAAKAISKLAAELGSALNIAAAACYGTDIYKKTQEVNSFIRSTANYAEYVSKQAMDAAAASSEIIATDLLNQATTSQSVLKTLLMATNTQFDALSAQALTDQKAVAGASKAEKQAEGTLEDAERDMSAIKKTVADSNLALNFGLTAAVTDKADGITVRFTPYAQPFPSYPADAGVYPGNDGAIPDAAPVCHVFVVRADKSAGVKLEQVEALFNAYAASRFVPVTAAPYETTIMFPESGNTLADIDGDPLATGVDYVVYLYMALSLPYQKYINSFNNILSSASQTVNVRTPLSAAENVGFGADKKSVLFTIQSDNIGAQAFRVMLLPAWQPLTGGLLTDDAFEEKSADGSVIHFYFNKTIAAQISSANYQLAYCKATHIDNGAVIRVMEAAIPDDMTDNFGSPLIAGMYYLPVVLSVPSDSVEPNAYASAMSSLWATTPAVLVALAGSEDVTSVSTPPAVSASGDSTAAPADGDENNEQQSES